VEITPDSAITNVYKIRFVDEIVGYMMVQIAAGDNRLYRTADNGYSWHYQAPYISGLPTADHYNYVTPCPNNYNTVLAGGLKTPGTDGIIVIGAS
jgi:hypothetical protein